MKAEFHGLRTTIYKVTDIAKAKAWYSKAFGVEPYFDEPFYVGFNVGGYELGLQPDGTASSGKSAGVVTYWGVDDAKKSHNRLLELGATEFEKPTDVGSDIVVAAVKDPWGNVVGVIYNPTFKLPAAT
jgi:predicted enzyme related to lactoylglutathione lyase